MILTHTYTNSNWFGVDNKIRLAMASNVHSNQLCDSVQMIRVCNNNSI